ncbi:hypothetical protein [Amycolatopsis sp. 195334CR]|uniref:hypothetical protein n=1 Tax=Amycolatopsis sp. 195334CR TaxID=2814588 RepID=UPI001A8F13D9|nr:hypothetical protein [Amycolatopsis sp. 195334CR]MBN6034185.1 hypothetical protein [Amycolatopsis sp. 195334CR]
MDEVVHQPVFPPGGAQAVGAALGFVPPRRPDSTVKPPPTSLGSAGWEPGLVLEHAGRITDHDLVPLSRRSVLSATLLTGATLAAELHPFLHPVLVTPDRRGTAFIAPELDAAEQFVSVLRTWHTTRGTVARATVAAQLSAHVNRLRAAPQGTAETLRGFRIGAELADIAATMAWDAGEHCTAQRYFVLAAQLAHTAGDDALAAVALASLARQCFDLGRPADGLEVVQLAQYGTRRTATPRLRAVLATREAWAYAQQGDVRAFQRAVGLAEDYHADGTQDRDATTPTARSLDAAELAGVIGARYRDLARYVPQHARRAQDYISRALQLRNPGRARNRAFDLIGLARAHLVTREPGRAAELIQAAVPLASAWTTGRVGVKLRDFHREAAPFTSVGAVREARETIADLIAA